MFFQKNMYKKTILVISNYENTIRWSKYYSAFRSLGYEVYSLCFSDRDVKCSLSVDLIPLDIRKVKPKKDYATSTCGWDFNYSLSRQGINPDKINVLNFKNKIFELFATKNYRFVFGEKTWPYEICISKIAKQLNVDYFTPVSIRIPQKYTFFSVEYETPININGCLSGEEINRIILAQKNGDKPAYFEENNKINLLNKFSANIQNFWTGRPEKLTDITIFWRILNLIRKQRNKRLVNSLRINNNTRYCIYVHVQPEASIDYLGGGLRKNDILVDWLSILNSEHSIMQGIEELCSIKFHTNYLGQFQGFAKECSWLSRNTNQSEINLLNGIVPITVSGTIALESLWKGVSPIVMGRPYFEQFSGIQKVTNYSEFKDALLNQDRIKVDISLVETNMRDICAKCFNSEDQQSIKNYVSYL